MRKCGFRDCNNWIEGNIFVCGKCLHRKENYRCDACLESEYNFFCCNPLGVVVKNVVGQTENLLQRTRQMFAKIPSSLHNLLKEMEQSLILTTEEKQAIIKKQRFWDNFLAKKNPGRPRDNIHVIKLCWKCEQELAKAEKIFAETNPDIKNMAKKWKANQKNHLRILKKIESEIGEENMKKIQKELEQEIKEKQLWVENYGNKKELKEENSLKIKANANNKNQEKKLSAKKHFLGIIFCLVITVFLIYLIIKKKKKYLKSKIINKQQSKKN